MKILEMRIRNIRGIPDITLTPQGENLVIWGPNGSGKSAIVDALDFLLTGRISRLLGEGTGGISLREHGPHINSKPEQATIEALIMLNSLAEPIKISRCIAQPTQLICDDDKRESIRPIMAIAERGQHVLSRREILKFITADSSTRAQGIQILLNITDIAKIRQGLVTTSNTLKREARSAQSVLETQNRRLASTANIKAFDGPGILAIVNQARAKLGGEAIADLSSQALKKGLERYTPDEKRAKPINPSIVLTDVKRIQATLAQAEQSPVVKQAQRLWNLLSQIFDDPLLQRAIARRELTQEGLDLIDNTGACPLCDHPWETGALEVYLRERLATADKSAEIQSHVNDICIQVKVGIGDLADGIKRIADAGATVALEKECASLLGWHQELNAFMHWLDNPLGNREEDFNRFRNAPRLLSPEDIVELLTTISSTISAQFPQSSEEDIAWDALTRLEENLSAVESAQAVLESAVLFQDRAAILLASFEATRDKVLENLYSQINNRFATLYRELHGNDEANFGSTIESEGAGLNFRVDFYGRGMHPPQALHSEGHQDSMGLCLYLALADQLTNGVIDLIVLDDVLMSVDEQHRRQVVAILKNHFPTRQFIITTHDKTWAKEVFFSGLVKANGSIEFSRWNIETGPIVRTDKNIWARIENALNEHDVNEAAFHLRYGAEHFFEMVCDHIQAKVVYQSRGAWALEDFMSAAQSTFGVLVRKGKSAAQSWGTQEEFKRLQVLDELLVERFAAIGHERWAVNPNVHYNNWASFSETDFKPVVISFKNVMELFSCSECGGLFKVAVKGVEAQAVTCSCGRQGWSLLTKKP